LKTAKVSSKGIAAPEHDKVMEAPHIRGYDNLKEGAQIMASSLNWSQCPAVESVPGRRSGAWVFKETRMPVSAVFENLQDMIIDELVEEFGVTREQVKAVLQLVAHSTEAPAPRP
jgi:uncharacterized protein (DUF433 family)